MKPQTNLWAFGDRSEPRARRIRSATRRTWTGKRRLQMEPLEHRMLLSVVPPFGPSELDPAAYDGIPIPSGDSAESGVRFRLVDNFSGTWSDAEKEQTSTEDDLLCWAAVASNMLEWTGWGFVDGMYRSDQLFDYYETHWTDEGGLPEFALQWFFSGVNGSAGSPGWSQVDVAGGAFYPDFDPYSLMHIEDANANIMTAIDAYANAGHAMGLSLRGAGLAHEVTCWGFNYDPADPDYYLGIWITDSDDNKNVADGYTAPNTLHYYDVTWDAGNGWWAIDSYHAGSFIERVNALERYSNGSVTINGDQDSAGQNDDIDVGLDATGSYLEVRINGTLEYSGLLSMVNQLNILGWGGDDTLTVDFTNGNPVPAGGFLFDGGTGGNDALAVVGNGSQIGSYLPGMTTGDGIVDVDGSAITFTGLEPVIVNGMAEFTFVTPNSNDVLTVDSPAAGQNRVSGTSGGVVFEALTFFDIDHFKIDTATNDGPLADPNDTVTWTADLVATGLISFTVETGAGDDVVNAAAVTALGVTLLGGDGDDQLTGGGGNDRLEGGDGQDTLTGNGGSDTLLGGAEADLLFPGVGVNIVDGGGGLDRVDFSTNSTSVGIRNSFGAVRIEAGVDLTTMSDVETIHPHLTANGTTLTVDDLAGTAVSLITPDFTVGGAADTLVVNGSSIADHIGVAREVISGGSNLPVVTTGWGKISIGSVGAANGDILRINGLEGDDVIIADDDVTTGSPGSILVTLDGGPGNDYLSADAVLIGGAGNDTLVGGPGNDLFDGGPGDDTIVGNGGTDTVVGGAGGDTILVEGTPGDDVITVTVVGGELVVNVNGNVTTYTETGGDLPDVERLVIQAGAGEDTISVVPLPTIAIDVDGGSPIGKLQQPVGDVLNVTSGGAAFTFQPGPEGDSGTLAVAGVQPVSFDAIELLQVDGANYIPADEFDQPDVVFPPNNSIATATVLGSPAKVTLRNLTLHDTGTAIDQDFFQMTAQDTGKLIFNAFFVDAQGDIDIQVQDSAGNIIAISQSISDDEQITIPVVSQEQYFLRVYSADGVPNIYNLEIENFAAPVPDAVVLDPTDDTGRSNSDNVTFDNLARIFIEADLAGFAAAGIDILDPAEVAAGDPGAAVEVFVAGVSVGFATPVAGTGDTLFEYTFTAGELSTAFVPVGGGGGLNFVKAAVRIFDGQAAQADDRTLLSEPLLVTLDMTAPALSTPDLLASSDSGASSVDNITAIRQPAFQGTAEVNTKVRVYANGILVGEGIVGSDATDGVIGNGLGLWEVTIEPLIDGNYTIQTRLEDLAGNLSGLSAGLSLTIDATPPQRPTIDLVNSDDTGWSDLDNVTIGDPDVLPVTRVADFRISAELGTTVLVKDGNVVIDTFVFDAAFDATDGVLGDGFGIRRIDFVANQLLFDIPAEGPHPLTVESVDTAGNATQSEQLLVEVDATPPLAPSTPDLLETSDSGADNFDDVTSINQPAFQGTAEANTKVRVYANGILVGEGLVGSDESDGVPNDGLGIWEVTVEPLKDGQFAITAQVEDQAGNISPMSDALVIVVDSAGLEPNDTLAEATILGSLPKITINDVILHDADDVDFLKYTAQDTGKLIVNIFSDGDVGLRVRDVNGNIIAVGIQSEVVAGLNIDGFVIPVVTQEEYFIEVFYDGEIPEQEVVQHVAFYDVEIENFAAPLVDHVDLPAKYTDPTSLLFEQLNDTGLSQFDNVTSRTDPEIILEADLDDFAREFAEGGGFGQILTAAQAAAGLLPGVAVEVFVNGNSVGFADLIVNSGNTLFRYTFDPGELPVTNLDPEASFITDSGGWLHYVKGAVRVFDGQRDEAGVPDPATGRTQLSEPLQLVVDALTPAAPSAPDLLETSDSGDDNFDNITSIWAPAFQGTAEHNGIIRIYANGVLVGEGRVGTDLTDDGFDQIGHWEVTVEPLKYGQFEITATVEDLAGNISPSSEPLIIVVDPMEPNGTLAEATILGSLQKITINDVVLHDVDDVDFFKYTAQDTGKLIVNIFSDGDVVGLRVRDANGNIIAVGTQEEVVPGLNIDGFVIPVVTQEEYFIEVFYDGPGVEQEFVQHVAFYDVEIENFAAPLVDHVDLPAKYTDPTNPLFGQLNDTGLSQFDNITSRTIPEIILEADLNEFFLEGITILTAAEAAAGLTPGAAVEVFVNGNSVGFADLIADSGETLFRYTFAPGVLPFTNADPEAAFYTDSGGWLHYVKGAVRIFDGQQDEEGEPEPATGRTQLSEPLELVVDTAPPTIAFSVDMLDASDSGRYNDDNVTHITSPAFAGVAEHNAIVRVYVIDLTDPGNPGPLELVGQGRVGTDLTEDGFNQVGTWEVTVEPLDSHSNEPSPLFHYASYEVVVEVEDLAGNIWQFGNDPEADPLLQIWIDTTAPNTPYLDLLGLEGLTFPGGELSDTGRHDSDNVTFDNTPTVTITVDDTPLGNGNPFPNTIIYRIYDRPDPSQFGGAPNNGELLLIDSFVTEGGFSADGFFTNTLPLLADGVHNLKIEVEDLAGNLSAD
ncbi:MAG: calcium-binding protein, partial [Pirellulaceae bacterium]|nr:calcium-binding protein [Pirellulaceae bacterium]